MEKSTKVTPMSKGQIRQQITALCRIYLFVAIKPTQNSTMKKKLKIGNY